LVGKWHDVEFCSSTFCVSPVLSVLSNNSVEWKENKEEDFFIHLYKEEQNSLFLNIWQTTVQKYAQKRLFPGSKTLQMRNSLRLACW
jgi:hypothetical protein